MKFQTLTDEEAKAVRAAKKVLDRLARQGSKAARKDPKMFERMRKELKKLGIAVANSTITYEEAVSLLLISKTYLTSTEDF